METVQILMSTYNGEKYLRAQLDSILEQDYPNMSILIRDDGSTDMTIEILKEYSNRYDCLSFYQGENIGVIKSNFDLMKNANPTADYYALSDQDDYWMKHKISKAVYSLKKLDKNKPLLYCGKTILTDKDLNELNVKIKYPEIRPNFYNALIENICTGCTAVFNKKLLDMVINNIPDFTVMHDWWLYLIASSFGQVYYDHESFIFYRQHGLNVVGARTNYWKEFKTRLRNYKNNRGKIHRQLEEYYKAFHKQIPDEQLVLDLLDAKKVIRKRFSIFKSGLLFRQRKIDNFIYNILLLIGQI